VSGDLAGAMGVLDGGKVLGGGDRPRPRPDQ